ncbi:MAG: hypothetical protein Fur0032_04560 [Terrimicrobiaceae bacterium]
MGKFLACLFLIFVAAGCASRYVPATKLEKANILPIELDDAFQFRKQKLWSFVPGPMEPTQSEAVIFERLRMEHGVVDSFQRTQRTGNYFSFFWRAGREADITVRFEYRQAALGNYVMAQERYYPAAKGSFQSDFSVIGDDYLEFGKVTAWRVLLIVDGRIVALSQSFIWR